MNLINSLSARINQEQFYCLPDKFVLHFAEIMGEIRRKLRNYLGNYEEKLDKEEE